MKLIIKGKLPNLNDYIKAERIHRQAAAKMKREAEDLVIWFAKSSLRGKINTPVIMHYVWYEPNRKRDLDNVSAFGRKVIQDALVKIHLLPGDGWAHVRGFTDRFEVDPQNPRIEITFEEVEQ